MKYRISFNKFDTSFSENNKYYDLIKWLAYHIFKPIEKYDKGFTNTNLFRILFWDIHRELTTEEIAWLKKYGRPPMHWNCRSILVPIEKEDDCNG